jgi:8-oxo-dGTP pyrophosphatase MutT (NUDIX family)
MIEKVTAFIVRFRNSKPQLLVFKHPSAGIQLPAGTIEEKEPVETALFREIKEETGLTQLKILKKLGDTLKFLDQSEAILTQTLRCFSWPAQASKRSGPLCHRGLRIQTFERKVGFTHVKYQEYDLNKRQPVLLLEQEGWLPDNALTRELHRHFYLLQVTNNPPDEWKIQTDGGNIFHCYWVDLDAIPELIGEHAEWLDQLVGISWDEIDSEV